MNARSDSFGARPLVLMMTAALASTGLAQNDEWGTGPGGNSARNSISTVVGPSAPTGLWSGSPVSDILETQPFIGDGFVATGRIVNFNIPTGSFIVAQDLFTGEELWRFQVPFNDNADNPDLDAEWRGRVSSVRGDRVYVTRAGSTRSAPIFALDAADGSVIWESEDLITTGSTEGNAFAPNGDLVVGSQVAGTNNQIPGSIMRIDKDTGETIWSTERSCPTSNGCQVAVANGKVYYFEAGPVVTAADLETGEVLFSTDLDDLGGGFVQQVSLFVGPDGTIFVPRGQQGLPGDMPGLEVDTFFALEDTGTSLEVLYGLPAGFVPFSTAGVTSDGSVYAYRTPEDDSGDLTGELIVLRIDSEGTIVDQSAPLPTTTVAPSPRMAIGADDTIYLSTEEILVSLNPDLTENWRVTDFADLGFPALGQQGVLVVSGGGTDLRAFQTEAPDCPADLTGPGGDGVPDGSLTSDDFFFYLALFADGDPQADLTGPGGDGVPDGSLTSDDFFFYLGLFAAGCP